MIFLRGLSRGGRVPVDAFEGHVHSVFDAAVNILLRDDLLITLLAAHHANQPRGIRVDVPQGLCFADHLSTGQSAACRGGMLRFASTDLQIDLRSTSLWRGSLHPVDIAQPGAALPVLRDVLKHHPAAEKSIAGGSPVAFAARQPILSLIEAARGCDPQGAADAAGRLIGLGPGLTPSGDDFLIGFLCGLRIVPHGAAREAFIAHFSAEIAHLSSHTNDISRAFLLDAAWGEAPEYIITLVDSIQSGHTGSIRAAAESLLATGRTSGADTLCGFLSALDI